MRVRTLLRYLIGDREAILQIAADRRAVWVGLLFVLSAGFAREYDGEDLLHAPWHVVIPLGASLLSSFLLFSIAYGALRLKRAPGPPFFSAYRSFLGLFWLTAPLAWLYAVPYERFLSPADAVRANLWTLALVSAWRVALMVRVVSVLMGYHALTALCVVMLFADALALAALQSVPLPVINVMGGVRVSESEAVLRNTALMVRVLGFCSLPLWLLCALLALAQSRPSWQTPPAQDLSARGGRGLWFLGLASLAVWAAVLPFTQPEQQLRSCVERLLKGGKIAEGLAEMSAHSPEDFPPHWDPPPRVGYGEHLPPLLDVLEAIADGPPASWVRSAYLRKFAGLLRSRHSSDGELERIARILEQFPEGEQILDESVDEYGYSAGAELKRRLDEAKKKHNPPPEEQGGKSGNAPNDESRRP